MSIMGCIEVNLALYFISVMKDNKLLILHIANYYIIFAVIDIAYSIIRFSLYALSFHKDISKRFDGWILYLRIIKFVITFILKVVIFITIIDRNSTMS